MKKVRSLFVLVLGGALLASAYGEYQEQAGSADLTAKVDKLFESYNKPTSPGCALSIMKDGRIAYKHAYGVADLDHDVPLTTTTILNVGSMSKQFTATAIVLLAQEGKLSLDDDIRKYVPEFPDLGARITLRHLLHHTSGVHDQLQMLALGGWRYSQDLITDDDVMDIVVHQKELNFKPGDEYMYSNTGYTLLAQVVKRVSGKSFREFTTARIFEPLGMKSTHFRDNFQEVVKGQAYAYVRMGSTFRLSVSNTDNVGPTSLLTTVEDLALWDENFYTPKIGGKALVDQLLEQGVLNNGEKIFYALGLGIDKYRGLTIVEHPGTDAGFAAEILRFPDQHFTVACLCNLAGSAPATLVRKIADIYLADKLDPLPPVPPKVDFTPVTLSEEQLATYPGLYFDEQDKQYLRMTRKPDGTSALLIRNEELRPTDKTHFYSVSGRRTLEFQAGPDGKWARFLTKDASPQPQVHTVTRLVEFAPTADQLKEFAGDFQSEEVEPVYHVSVEGGKLVLRHFKSQPAALAPLIKDLFQVGTSRITLQFMRNDKGQVTAFGYSNSRIRNVKFKRKAG